MAANSVIIVIIIVYYYFYLTSVPRNPMRSGPTALGTKRQSVPTIKTLQSE